MFRMTTALLLCCLGYAQSAHALTVQLNPSRDNTLHQRTDPNAQTSNATGDIFVGRTNQDGQDPATISIRRGLIYFDIAGASIPSNAIITSVTMQMRDVMGLNGDHAANLHRLLADWGEGTSFFSGGQGAPATQDDATWLYRFYNTANPASSPAWITPGGDFSPTISGTSIISDDLGGGQTFTWASTPGMVADVQFWLENPTSNFGWLIQGNEALGQTAKRLNSRESNTPPNMAPLLEIEFILPPPAPEPGTAAAVWGALTIAGMVRRRKRRSSSAAV